MKLKVINIRNYSRQYLQEYKNLSFETALVGIRRKIVLKYLNQYQHKHILEIGCGLEPLFLYCKDYETYTIVEPSDCFVQNAKKLAQRKNNLHIVHGYMEETYRELLQHNKWGFDFIILSSVLHQVPDPRRLLRSIYKLCGKNTVVHINVPNMYSFHRLLACEMGLIKSIFDKSQEDIKFQKHTQFDKERLLKLLKIYGFNALSQGTYFIKPFTHGQLEKIIKKNIVNRDVIQGLESMIKYMPDLGCEMFVNVKINPYSKLRK